MMVISNHSLSRVRVFMVKRNSSCNAKVKAIKENQLNHVYWDLGRCSMMITVDNSSLDKS